MINRIMLAVAVFTTIAAYQFGYYQGRLSASAEHQAEAVAPAPATAIAVRPVALPPVTPKTGRHADHRSAQQALSPRTLQSSE